MLTRLRARGYKALRDFSATFEPLSVIVGPNGCGKTSVLEAIELAGHAAQKGARTKGSIPEEAYSKGDEQEQILRVELTAQVDDSDAETVRRRWETLQEGKSDNSEVSKLISEAVNAFRESHPLPPSSPSPPPGPDEVRTELFCDRLEDAQNLGFFPDSWTADGREETTGLVLKYFASIQRLSLDTRILSAPSYLAEPDPWMRPNGEGLATVLNWLLGERDDRFLQIEERLRGMVPDVRRIRTRRVPMETIEPVDIEVGVDDEGRAIFEKRSYRRERAGHQVVIDYAHADGVPATHVSEGTLLLLGLLCVVATTNAATLLLDDIERGLHPKTQQQLVEYLREVSQGGLQVIATSHSPYLLLHLDYDQVRAMTLDGSRGSQIGKLTEHPEFERWKEEMSPSEFWTVFGESWLEERASE